MTDDAIDAVTPASTESRTGRPRDPGRDAAILGATLELLGEVGYERVTVRAIAQRAGAGLATIYRRWPTKEDLVVDAITSFRDLPAPPGPSDDPIENVVGVASVMIDMLQGPQRGLIPNLIGQLPRNPELAETLRTRVIPPRLGVITEQLRALPDVDPERVEDAAVLIPATLFFKSLVLGQALTEDDVRQVIHQAIRAAAR